MVVDGKIGQQWMLKKKKERKKKEKRKNLSLRRLLAGNQLNENHGIGENISFFIIMTTQSNYY